MLFLESLIKFFPDDIAVHDFIVSNTTNVTLKKGELLSQSGSYNRNINFVEKGLLRTFHLQNGKEITTNFYPEGRLVANIDTLFQNVATSNNIEALEDSIILSCDYEMLDKLCQESLAASNFARYILSHLLIQATERISSLQYMSAKEKYQELLQDNKAILQRVPLRIIASFLGISPETLSRIRTNV